MLIAEVHGRVLEAAKDDEDYLTSAVFGHLRYVRPSVFWEDFFAHTKGSPIAASLCDQPATQTLNVLFDKALAHEHDVVEGSA